MNQIAKRFPLNTTTFLHRRYFCSSKEPADDENPIGSAEKLAEFFKKAERSVIEDQKSVNNQQLTTSKESLDLESHMTVSPPTSDSQVPFGEKDKGDENTTPYSLSFVPWTMSTFLKEINISKFLSERMKGPEKSFATLLRHSPFIQLGDFKSRELVGVVIDNVNNSDLYIDFGGKFHCVCPQPANQFYPRGSLVRIRLKNPEITDKFMINTKGISIFEADATLLGPYKGRLVRYIAEEDKPVTIKYGDGAKRHRSSTDEDNVALEHWRLN